MFSQNSFQLLSDEFILFIFSFLDIKDLYPLCLVNKQLRNLIRHDLIWQKKLCNNFQYDDTGSSFSFHKYQTTVNENYNSLTANQAKLFTLVKEGNLIKIKKLITTLDTLLLADTDGGTKLIDWANLKNHQNLLDYFFKLVIKEYSNFRKKIDFKKANIAGMTILHWAAACNQFMLVDQFILQRCDVNAKIQDVGFKFFARDRNSHSLYIYTRMTPLHIAALYGRVELIENLLKNGANIEAPDGRNLQPLHYAANNGHNEAVKRLLSKYANVNSGTQANAYRDALTPLHLAAANGEIEVMTTLLENGAQVNAFNPKLKYSISETPLDKAVKQGQIEAIDFLLKHNAKIDGHGSFRDSPLYIAIENNQPEVVKYLITKGATLNDEYIKNGQLFLTAADYSPNSLDFLLEISKSSTIKIDIQILFLSYCKSALIKDDTIKVFIKHGININASFSDKGDTLLHICVEKDASDHLILSMYKYIEENITILIKNGANTNAVRNDGETPLHIAVQNPSYKIIRLLLKNGADINLPRLDGETPLSLAAYFKDGILDLLKNESNINDNICKKRKDNNVLSKVNLVFFPNRSKQNKKNSDESFPLQVILPSKKDDDDNSGIHVQPHCPY